VAKTKTQLTLQYLLTKYGLTLNALDLAEVFHMEYKCVLNAVSAGRFPVPTFKLGKKRYAHVEDVAAHIDKQRVTNG
jgi:hypothetical protein